MDVQGCTCIGLLNLTVGFNTGGNPVTIRQAENASKMQINVVAFMKVMFIVSSFSAGKSSSQTGIFSTSRLLSTSLQILTLSLSRVINFNFLFQSLTRDTSYSMENLAIVCSDES